MKCSDDIMWPPENFASCVGCPCMLAVISFRVSVSFLKNLVASCADIRLHVKFVA